MSQKEMADVLGVTQASVSAVERNNRPVPEAWLKTLREKFADAVEGFVLNPTPTEDIVVPRPVWEVLQSQADTMAKQASSLNKRDQYLKELIEMFKAMK